MSSKNSTIPLTITTDADIKEHIISLKSNKVNATKTSKRAKKKYYFYESENSDEKSKSDGQDDSENDKIPSHSSNVLAETADIAGENLYGFRQKVKSNQMINKAQDSVISGKENHATPKKSNKKKASTNVTPSTRSSRAQKNKTPSSRVSPPAPPPASATRRAKSTTSATSVTQATKPRPRLTANKLRARNNYRVDSSESDSPESSDEDVVNCDSDKEEDNYVKPQGVDDYFTGQASGLSSLTTEHTLARLDMPRMDAGRLKVELSSTKDVYADRVGGLVKSHRRQFHTWALQMCSGFNILLYGVGSKRNLLNDFRSLILSDFSHVVVNGYFPSLTIKSILIAITEDILETFTSFRNIIDHAQYIKDHYSSRENGDFYIIVHNIDGPMLQAAKTQAILGLLAQTRHIHIIASVDHINAPLLWDGCTAAKFNWTYHDATTFSPYAEETSYENSLLVKHSGSLALSSLRNVTLSLTSNARGIFRILIDQQMAADENSNIQGFALPDLYQKCREAFLVNSDLTLRTQLIEFVDHKLIKMKKGLDGVEYLTIPLDNATLAKYLEEQDK